MKSLIFKEIRECSLVCLVAMVALGCVFATVQYKLNVGDLPLVSQYFHSATAFGYPAFGVWLGLTQVMVDRRRGRWDFLIHRPISPTRIFIAKVTAGTALYLITAAVPLFAAAIWTAGPFDWTMIIPRLADLFSGLPWYAAGLLLAARNARWFGSRLMPQGMALVASIAAVAFAFNFLQAIAIFAAALAILLPAAAGAFVFGGEYEPEPLWLRFVQGVSIGPGLVISCIVVAGLLAQTISLVWTPQAHWSVASYVVEADGRILQYKNGPGAPAQMTDFNGGPLPESEMTKYQNLFTPRSYLNLLDVRSPTAPRQLRATDLGFQNPDYYARQLLPTRDDTWFYLVNSQTIVGYGNWVHRFIGSIGPSGFAGPSAPPVPFPEPLINVSNTDTIASSATTVYSFNPEESRSLRPVFTTPGTDPIIDATELYGPTPRDILILTRSAIHIVKNGHEIFQVPVERSYPSFASIEVTRVQNGHFIFQYTNAEIQNGSQPGDYLVETDAQGNILSRRQLPAHPWTSPEDNPVQTALGYLAVPPAIAMLRGDSEFSTRDKLACAAVGILSAAAAMLRLRQRHTRWATRITWALITLLMGVSGLLLLLALRQRVARIPCQSCHKPRPVTEEKCPNCQAPFAPPKMEGVEIFELV